MTVLTSRIHELQGPRDLAVREQRLDPGTLGPDEVCCVTRYTAVSAGTEMAAWRGDPPLRPMKVYPRLVGYCNVARVVAAGPEAGYAPGDVVLNQQSHRSAFVCPASRILGPVPPGADEIAVSTAYLFHLGYNALHKGGVTAGHNVAVIGLGALGLGALAVARLAGARAWGLSGQKGLETTAEAMGAQALLPKDAGAARAALDQATGGVGADVVVTTSNTWDDWRLALELARAGGTVCVLGFPGRAQPEPDFNPLHSRWFYDKQLTLRACGFSPEVDVPAKDLRFTLKRNMAYLMERMAAGALDPSPIIGGVLPWTDLASVYARLEAREPGLYTCILDWGGAHEGGTDEGGTHD